MLVRSTVLGVVLALTASASVALACDSRPHEQALLKKIGVEELAAMQKAEPGLRVIDANDTETRTKYGVIPGATLLSNYDTYDVTKELPADKGASLVFYCGGPKCQSAPKAAEKAAKAGYTRTFVLEAGIKGWVSAKQPVHKPSV